MATRFADIIRGLLFLGVFVLGIYMGDVSGISGGHLFWIILIWGGLGFYMGKLLGENKNNPLEEDVEETNIKISCGGCHRSVSKPALAQARRFIEAHKGCGVNNGPHIQQ